MTWMRTRTKWLMLYGTEHDCHYCGHELTANKDELGYSHKRLLTLDHLIARSRMPSMRYMLVNLIPACDPCNRRKGSLSHDEYVHECHTPLPA